MAKTTKKIVKKEKPMTRKAFSKELSALLELHQVEIAELVYEYIKSQKNK